MTNTPMTKEDVLLDLYKIYAYNPNDAVGNPLTPFGNFCEGYKASQAQQASEIEALKHDLYSYMEASNGYVNEIMKQEQTIAELSQALKEHELECITKGTENFELKAVIAELVEALEIGSQLNYNGLSQAETVEIMRKAIAKVKGK